MLTLAMWLILFTCVLPECAGWPPLVQSCVPCGLSAGRRGAGDWGGRGRLQTTGLSHIATGLQ